MEYAIIIIMYELCGIHTKLLVLLVLKESNIEQQDGLYQATADLTVYQTYTAIP